MLDDGRQQPHARKWRMLHPIEGRAGKSNVTVRPIDNHRPPEDGGALPSGDEPGFWMMAWGDSTTNQSQTSMTHQALLRNSSSNSGTELALDS
ncbi:hypothetical protein H9L39_20024 [Fusarium oxysporum f. sp. albedinis]|nr:hypothetical protein H9L39_20024 [Fusarium oxysporum f. sp. albedinis]